MLRRLQDHGTTSQLMPYSLSCCLGKDSVIPAKPQPPKFLDVTLKFLDVIVVKREGKYKKIRSFVPKHRIFYLKTSDLFMQKVKDYKFYIKLCEYLLKLFQHLPLYQTKKIPCPTKGKGIACFYE